MKTTTLVILTFITASVGYACNDKPKMPDKDEKFEHVKAVEGSGTPTVPTLDETISAKRQSAEGTLSNEKKNRANISFSVEIPAGTALEKDDGLQGVWFALGFPGIAKERTYKTVPRIEIAYATAGGLTLEEKTKDWEFKKMTINNSEKQSNGFKASAASDRTLEAVVLWDVNGEKVRCGALFTGEEKAKAEAFIFDVCESVTFK